MILSEHDAKRCGDTFVKMTELPKHLKKLYEEK